MLLTNEDTQFCVTGVWAFATPPTDSTFNNPTFYGQNFRTIAASGGAETATARWEFGILAPSPGLYSFDAFIPDTQDSSGTAVIYRLQSAPWTLMSGCGTYANLVTFAGVNADTAEGRWLQIGTQALQPVTCYRLVLSNQGNTGAVIQANAVRAERMFESSATITDMPRLASNFAPGTTFITSNSSAVPTIIATLTVTCPESGQVITLGSGESAAQSGLAGSNFIGLAYSISKNSTASDPATVVQSSALAVFNGDANRDFLNVSRIDNCADGESITYRLTGYRAQPATSTASFMWNGRLTGQFFSSGF